MALVLVVGLSSAYAITQSDEIEKLQSKIDKYQRIIDRLQLAIDNKQQRIDEITRMSENAELDKTNQSAKNNVLENHNIQSTQEINTPPRTEPDYVTDFKTKSIEVSYDELITNSEKYLDKKIHYKGLITDVLDYRIDDCGEGYTCHNYEFIASRHSGAGNYVEPIAIFYYPLEYPLDSKNPYSPNHGTLKKGDYIELWGTFNQILPNVKSSVGIIKIPQIDVNSVNIEVIN